MRQTLLASCCMSALTAQGMWNQTLPANVPAARLGHAMALDPVSERVVMFAGCTSVTPATYANDLWQWTGTDWQQIATSGATPLSRRWCGFCNDGNGSLLMFGGLWPGWPFSGQPTVLNDTWRLHGNQWTQVASTGPSPREAVAMAPTPQGVLLFGGSTLAGSVLGDTWLWNGSSWTQLSPPTSPLARAQHRLVFDPVRGVVVLFGGWHNSSWPLHFGDTWEWNGATWLQRSPAHSPPPRFAHAMAFSPTTSQTVAHGGLTNLGLGTTLVQADTWQWDGNDWHQLGTVGTAPARASAAMAFAPAAQGAVLFGGGTTTVPATSTTFEFFDSLATVTTFGSGCVGPNAQVPSLAAAPGALPRLGTTMQFRIGNLPPSFTVPILVLGLSNTVANGPPAYPLPFDLGVLGWTGCQQLVSIDATTAAVSFADHIDLPLSIPLTGSLVGFTCHGQAVVLYPATVAVSNGLTAVVGA